MNSNQEQQILKAALPPLPLPPPPQQQNQQQQKQQYALTNTQKQYALLALKHERARQAAQQKQDNKDRRSRVEEMLEWQNRATPVVFTGLGEYRAMDAAYKSLSNRDEGHDEEVPMDGFPVTDADRAPLVAQLTAAIMDFSYITDKPMNRQAAGTKKQTAGMYGLTAGSALMTNSAVNAIQNLSTFEVQLLAWKILCAICDAHCGSHDIPLWTKVWKYNSYESFHERFGDVRHAVRRSKALLKSILDTDIPFVKRLAAGPRAEYKTKQENREMNERRAAQRKENKKRKLMEVGQDGGNGGDYMEQPYVGRPGDQAPLHGYKEARFPSRDCNSEPIANEEVINNPSLQSNKGMMDGQGGNFYTSGDDFLGISLANIDFDLTDFDTTTFESTVFDGNAFDTPSAGGQGHNLAFGADPSIGMDGTAKNKLRMPPWAQQGQTTNQARTEFGMEDTGGQVSKFEQTTGRQGVNGGTSRGNGNREDIHQDAAALDGQDAEYSDFLGTEMDFDRVNALSPITQRTLATLEDSAGTQVTQEKRFPAGVNQAKKSVALGSEGMLPASETSILQSLEDEVKYHTFLSNKEDWSGEV